MKLLAMTSYREGYHVPSRSTIHELRHRLGCPEFGAGFLSNNVEDVWDPQIGTQGFLVFNSLIPNISQILFSLRRLFSRNTSPEQSYSGDVSTDRNVARGISTVLSSVFPVLQLIMLLFVHNLLVRIGLILVFTAVPAAILVFGLMLEPEKVLAIITGLGVLGSLEFRLTRLLFCCDRRRLCWKHNQRWSFLGKAFTSFLL